MRHHVPGPGRENGEPDVVHADEGIRASGR